MVVGVPTLDYRLREPTTVNDKQLQVRAKNRSLLVNPWFTGEFFIDTGCVFSLYVKVLYILWLFYNEIIKLKHFPNKKTVYYFHYWITIIDISKPFNFLSDNRFRVQVSFVRFLLATLGYDKFTIVQHTQFSNSKLWKV